MIYIFPLLVGLRIYSILIMHYRAGIVYPAKLPWLGITNSWPVHLYLVPLVPCYPIFVHFTDGSWCYCPVGKPFHFMHIGPF
jgi:hypothetical protein